MYDWYWLEIPKHFDIFKNDKREIIGCCDLKYDEHGYDKGQNDCKFHEYVYEYTHICNHNPKPDNINEIFDNEESCKYYIES